MLSADPRLELPVRGRRYRIRAPEPTVLLQLQTYAAGVRDGLTRLEGEEGAEFVRLALGDDVLAEMITNKVPAPFITHAALTAWGWAVNEQRAAAQHAAAGDALSR